MGLFRDMTPEQKDEIIKLIKEHTDKHHNTRVGWAAREILKGPASPATVDKLAAEIETDIRYRKERKGDTDWNIVKNVTYDPKERRREKREKRIWQGLFLIMTILTVGVSMRQCSQQDKTSALEELSSKQSRQLNRLKSDSIDHTNLLKTKDKEIIEIRQSLDSLTIKLNVKK